jgi:uncharacterized protein YoxC
LIVLQIFGLIKIRGIKMKTEKLAGTKDRISDLEIQMKAHIDVCHTAIKELGKEVRSLHNKIAAIDTTGQTESALAHHLE